jgi:membrane glycosyltransferase
MAFHTLFIVCTLAGHCVEWDAQSRNDSAVTLGQAWRVHRGQTIAGFAAMIAVALLAPESLIWLTPILVGLVLSIPISMAVSSAPLGAWFKRHGLLSIPEEVVQPAIVQLFAQARRHIRTLACPARSQLFQRFLDDPVWLRSHFAMLEAIAAVNSASPAMIEECRAGIRLGRWSEMANSLKQTLLSDPAALTELHHDVWKFRSLQLAASNRTIVHLPAGQFALADGDEPQFMSLAGHNRV